MVNTLDVVIDAGEGKRRASYVRRGRSVSESRGRGESYNLIPEVDLSRSMVVERSDERVDESIKQRLIDIFIKLSNLKSMLCYVMTH